jgi:DNA invertase Pin-like site-specific DNA recombinase
MIVQTAQNGLAWARRTGPQAGALLALFTAAGLLARSLGGPVWLTVLYACAGAAGALARVAWPRRRPAHAARPPAVVARPEARSRPMARPPLRRDAIGYIQIPTAGDRQALSAHHSALAAYADEHALALTVVVHDVERPAGGQDGRPALRWALDRIADGDAQVLAVVRLDHVAGDAAELSALLHWFAGGRRALVAVDPGIDTSTEAGRVAARALEGVGGWERRRPAPPPPEAPAPARVPHGRAAVADRSDLQQRILALRAQGLSLQAIADHLNAEGVPTVRGGAMWRPSSVQRATGYRRPRPVRRGIEVPRTRPDAPGA